MAVRRPRFGVLAEDDTDCDAIKVLIRRITGQPKAAVSPRAGGGNSVLRRKAERWMRDLATKGCEFIIIVHDLDRGRVTLQLNDECALHAKLSSFAVPATVKRLVCIPVEELEAWFWADEAVVRTVGRGQGKAVVSPELVKQPKEKLMKLSRDRGGKPLYSTNDNPDLAAKLNLDVCAARCRSFRILRSFLRAAVGLPDAT
jgi:hypothetical protein